MSDHTVTIRLEQESDYRETQKIKLPGQLF